MAYRIVKITKPSEVHVTNHQLICEQEEAKFSIPLEDIEIIICIVAKIRFSTMGLGEITQAGIIVVGFGKKHETQTLIEPCRAMIDGKIMQISNGIEIMVDSLKKCTFATKYRIIEITNFTWF